MAATVSAQVPQKRRRTHSSKSLHWPWLQTVTLIVVRVERGPFNSNPAFSSPKKILHFRAPAVDAFFLGVFSIRKWNEYELFCIL